MGNVVLLSEKQLRKIFGGNSPGPGDLDPPPVPPKS